MQKKVCCLDSILSIACINMDMRSQKTKYHNLDFRRPVHLVLIVIFCISGLVAMGPQVHAQPLTLAEIVANVDSEADTPNIDAAVVMSDSLCTLQNSSEPTKQGGPGDSTIPSRFHAASISKLFTAIAIMQLRDEGALSLHDQAGVYVSAFYDSPILIKHLLTHTSGLRDRQRADGRTTEAEVDAYIRSLASQNISQMPGSDWRYADAGFNLLGRIIEHVTGKPYSVVMKERLLEPIGMRDSDFNLSHIPVKNRVQAYDKRGRPQEHPWDLAFLPSSGLQTTAADLALFAQAVLKISDIESQRILSPESLHEMTVGRMATDWHGVMQGYGWQLANTPQGPQWRHAGGEAGFESLLTIYPETDFGIAVLGNKRDWPRFELERAIRSGLLKTQNICTGN